MRLARTIEFAILQKEGLDCSYESTQSKVCAFRSLRNMVIPMFQKYNLCFSLQFY